MHRNNSAVFLNYKKIGGEELKKKRLSEATVRYMKDETNIVQSSKASRSQRTIREVENGVAIQAISHVDITTASRGGLSRAPQLPQAKGNLSRLHYNRQSTSRCPSSFRASPVLGRIS